MKKESWRGRFRWSYVIIPIITLYSVLINRAIVSETTLAYPDFFFSQSLLIKIIGVAIYILNTTSILIVWNTFPRDSRFRWIIGTIAFTMLMNTYFAYQLYSLHMCPGVLRFELVLIGLAAWARIILMWPVSKRAALLLVPYAITLILFGYLSYINCSNILY